MAQRLGNDLAAYDLRVGLRPVAQHLPLPPEEGEADDDEQNCKDEVGGGKESQGATFFGHAVVLMNAA